MGAGDITALGAGVGGSPGKTLGDGTDRRAHRPCLTSSPTHRSLRSRRSGSGGTADWLCRGGVVPRRGGGAGVGARGRRAGRRGGPRLQPARLRRGLPRAGAAPGRAADRDLGAGRRPLVRRRRLAAARGPARRDARPRGPGVGREHPRHRRRRRRDERGRPRGRAGPGARWAVICGPDGRRRVGRDDLELGYRRSSVAPGEVVAAAGLRAAPGRPGGHRGAPRRVPRPPAGHPAPGRAHLRQRLHQPARRLGRPAAGGRRLQGPGGGRRALLAGPRQLHRGRRPGCRAGGRAGADGRGPPPRDRRAAGRVLAPEVRYLDPERGIVHAPLAAA